MELWVAHVVKPAGHLSGRELSGGRMWQAGEFSRMSTHRRSRVSEWKTRHSRKSCSQKAQHWSSRCAPESVRLVRLAVNAHAPEQLAHWLQDLRHLRPPGHVDQLLAGPAVAAGLLKSALCGGLVQGDHCTDLPRPGPSPQGAGTGLGS